MHRTIIVCIWIQRTINGRITPRQPYSCHISRNNRMHYKYHKNITDASLARLRRYIDMHMVETVRSHKNFIKYETREIKPIHKPRIQLLKADGWEAIVINGKLVDEGHSFKSHEILKLLQDIEIIDYKFEDYRDYGKEDSYEDDLDKYRDNQTNDEIY